MNQYTHRLLQATQLFEVENILFNNTENNQFWDFVENANVTREVKPLFIAFLAILSEKEIQEFRREFKE